MAGTTHIMEEIYGHLPEGRAVKIFTLRNSHGLVAKVMEYGASLVSMATPDRDGVLADLTHGYDTLAGWLTNDSYLGATVGRFANRIRDGKFHIDGVEYALALNNTPGGHPSALHGGLKGFDKVLWVGEMVGADSVELSYHSAAGEEGYPGNLSVKVRYTLTEENELKWTASATTDVPTIVNLVHHSYWNLSGEAMQSVESHVLTLNAESYLPTDAGLIPTGERAAVAGTPMDFTQPHVIGERIGEDFTALKLAGGYDHAWILPVGGEVRFAARLEDPRSGRVMEISTNQAAIQFYSGNFLDGETVGKGGVRYAQRTALCLETQGFPDAPNQPNFPSTVLRPGEVYQHEMVHRFSVA